MARHLAAVGLVILALSSAGLAQAAERAEWGVAVTVGADAGDYALLLRNDEGFHLVALDPWLPLRAAGGGPMTLGDLRPGDRLDYAVTPWAGMEIVELAEVTPVRHAAARAER